MIKGNNESTLNIDDFIKLKNLKNKLKEYIVKIPFDEYFNIYYELLFEVVQPNISLDEKFTKNAVNQAIKKVSPFPRIYSEKHENYIKKEKWSREKNILFDIPEK